MKMMKLEVWIGNCAKSHCGAIDPDIVKVAIQCLSFTLPHTSNTKEPVCFTDYKKACFYLDDWADVVGRLSADEFNCISCKVHFDEEDNVRTLNYYVCGDMLESLANGISVNFEELNGCVGCFGFENVWKNKPLTKFEMRIGMSHTMSRKFCEISECCSGTPHDDITECCVAMGFSDLKSLRHYMQTWCDVFVFFGRKSSEIKVTVYMNIESLHKVYKFDNCMELLADLEQSYTKCLRYFPV